MTPARLTEVELAHDRRSAPAGRRRLASTFALRAVPSACGRCSSHSTRHSPAVAGSRSESREPGRSRDRSCLPSSVISNTTRLAADMRASTGPIASSKLRASRVRRGARACAAASTRTRARSRPELTELARSPLDRRAAIPRSTTGEPMSGRRSAPRFFDAVRNTRGARRPASA